MSLEVRKKVVECQKESDLTEVSEFRTMNKQFEALLPR